MNRLDKAPDKERTEISLRPFCFLFIPESFRRHSRYTSEDAREVEGVLEAHLFGNVLNGHIRVDQVAFCYVYPYMVAVFCGVVNCPLASVILSIEMFGAEGIALFGIACAVSYIMSGHSGLYKSQSILYSKITADTLEEEKNEEQVVSVH